MVGYSEAFVPKHGKNLKNFMEQVKIFYLPLKMEISLLFIIGLALMINFNGGMRVQLASVGVI